MPTTKIPLPTSPSSSFITTDSGDHVLLDALNRLFGYSSFRKGQLEIIRATMGGRDVFGVMPTGGGKSLCYQLPSHMMSGTCLVISPLIALMKDQVDSANATGLAAACINSSLQENERTTAYRRLLSGDLDLLYVSPERFALGSFLSTLQQAPVNSIAIDEAHCISEWGHNFRPDYLTLSRIPEVFPELSIAAFTATATPRVQQDIVDRLGLRSPLLVRASFNRPNLFYEVQPKHDTSRQMLAFLRGRPNQQGIVYRTTRDSVEKTAVFLQDHGIRALPYHAGLDDSTRHKHQELFNKDETDVIVATIAFGMGIDKSNVRFVVHGDLPKNMESYYQETGRAGRDGAPAHCLLLFGRSDIPRIRHFIDQVTDQQEHLRLRGALDAIVEYAQSPVCRRRAILSYFGETFAQDSCGACDNCTADREEIDVTRHAQMLLSAIMRTGQRFGMSHVIDVVRGADTQKIRSFGHERLPTWGAGKDQSKAYWRNLTDELIRRGFAQMTNEQYPRLRLHQPAESVLKGDTGVTIVRRKTTTREKPAASDMSQALFDYLRQLRKHLAAQRGVPPYIVFTDRTLWDLVRRKPSTRSDLISINGIGEAKRDSYGEVVLKAIKEFRGNDSSAPVPRSAGPRRSRIHPANAGKPWGPDDGALLRHLYEEGKTIADLARQFDRTRGAITARLIRTVPGVPWHGSDSIVSQSFPSQLTSARDQQNA